MKQYTFSHKITGEEITVTLDTGDVIEMTSHKGLKIEIGPNDTMRAIINGTPAPTGFQPIPDKAVKELCQRKHFSSQT